MSKQSVIDKPTRAIRGRIARDAVRRFPNLPTLTLAKYINERYGTYFENDLEAIRANIRYYRGQLGKKNRRAAKDKHLFTDKVTLPPTWRGIKTDYKLKEGLWFVISDIHVPFHEPKAIESAFSAAQAEKVDGVLINGDLQDCSALSYWQTANRDFNAEVELVIDFLDFLRQEFPKQQIVYKPGNHEYRLPRYYITHAPELADTPLACMETLLGFEERKIEFLDYFQKVMAGMLPIIHGHEIRAISRAVNPARGLYLKAKTFCACSHCHTPSMHPAKDIHGNLLTTWSFGCLCDLEPDWNPFGNDWGWGFAFVNVEKDGNFEVVNKRILPNGKVV